MEVINNSNNKKENINKEDLNNENGEKRLTLSEIEYYILNNITPPGVKEYNDLPSNDVKEEPSKSIITKVKKVLICFLIESRGKFKRVIYLH